MKSIIKLIIIQFFLLQTVFSLAQNVPTNPMQPFLDLKGHWEARVKLTFGETEFNITYLLNFEKASDNSGVVLYEKTTIPGIGTLNSTNLIGFDPYDGKYHWFTVDNFGTTHDHIGSFSDETHFYMEHNSTRDGKAFQEKIWIEWINPNAIKLILIASTDGVVEQTAEGIFYRRGRGN